MRNSTSKNGKESLAEYPTWKIEFEKTHFKFYTDDASGCAYGCLKPNRSVVILTERALRQRYKHKYESQIKAWLVDPEIRIFEGGLHFVPPRSKQPCPENAHNLWIPFKWEAKELSDLHAAKGLKYFKALLKHLANDQKKDEEFLTRFLADIIQNPGRKPGVALILKGKQGLGKNTLTDILGSLLENKSFETSNAKDYLYCRFNDHIRDKLLVIVNESDSKTNFENDGKLKSHITDATQSFEIKFSMKFTAHTYYRMIILTNHPNPVAVYDASERRFFVCEPRPKKEFVVGKEKVSKKQFFSVLHSLDDTDYCAIFMYLRNVVVPATWFLHLPDTDAKKMMRRAQMPSWIAFLADFVLMHKAKEQHAIKNKDLYDLYTCYCSENGIQANRVFPNDKFQTTILKEGQGDHVEHVWVEKTHSGSRGKIFYIRESLEWLALHGYVDEDELDSDDKHTGITSHTQLTFEHFLQESDTDDDEQWSHLDPEVNRNEQNPVLINVLNDHSEEAVGSPADQST